MSSAQGSESEEGSTGQRQSAETGYEIVSGKVPSAAQLLALYEDVGWTSYTRDPEGLRRAVAGSSLVLTVWSSQDGSVSASRLLGLLRALSDGETICYIQDVLVHPLAQRRGLGGRLIALALEQMRHIRQVVLLTDAEPRQRAFYESAGLTEVRDLAGEGLRAFVRIG